MTINKLPVAFVTFLLAAVSPSVVGAQTAPKAEPARTAQAGYDMRMRLSAAVDRVRVTEQHGKITPQRSAALRRQLMDAQTDLVRLTKEQGFTSAAELASYDRLVRSVDQELRDAASARSYGNDALQGPESTAFQRIDARLHYRNARIEYNSKGCAFYQGTSRGKVRRVALCNQAGRAHCNNR